MNQFLAWSLKLVPGVGWLLPQVVFAAAPGKPLVPCGGPGQPACTLTDLFVLLGNIYNLMLGLGGLVALLFIIWGGIQMILGFLDGGDHYVQTGKETLKNGII